MTGRKIDIFLTIVIGMATVLLPLPGKSVAAEGQQVLELRPLIDEALGNGHEVYVTDAKWKAASAKVRQAGSLPDPMFMIGYQNEGWDRYTFGKMQGAQWMYSVSQMFPFPGKRSLREEMATRDADAAGAVYRAARLDTIAKVKELYYELFLAYKDLDLVRERTSLFGKIEDAALARYATGTGRQEEVLMAQTEKYMLLERETMLEQKKKSVEAMLIATVGREDRSPLARPAEPAATPFSATEEDLIQAALESSPDVQARQQLFRASEAGVAEAKKEYYPDVTLTGTVGKRSGPFEDMWSVTASFNIPLYYRSRQSQALAAARAESNAAIHDLAGIKAMVTSNVRDSFAMVKSSEQLMELYRAGLIPKTEQDFELSLSGYRTGKVEGITVVSRLKALLDYETSYWTQFVQREKAIARLEALTGGEATGTTNE